MKKLIWIAIIMLTVMHTSQAQEVKSQTRNIGTFNEIYAGKGINVTLIEGDKEKIEVNIENGEVSDVITKLAGRKLSIKLKTKIYKNVGVQVFVTYKSLKAISTGTGAFIDAKDIIRAQNLDLKAGTGSTIILEIDTKAVKSSLTSSKIELVGKTEFQDISVNAGGRYIANELKSTETFVKTSTGGSAWVNVSEKLEASTSTGGKVIYQGSPNKLITKGNVSQE